VGSGGVGEWGSRGVGEQGSRGAGEWGVEEDLESTLKTFYSSLLTPFPTPHYP